MKFLFSSDENYIHNRSRYFRGGLLKNYHDVKVLRNYNKVPPADMWLHGVSDKKNLNLESDLISALRKFSGKVIFYQNDDSTDFAIHKIPIDLIEKAVLFLRNIWPSDQSKIHESIGYKTGLINPLLKPLRAIPGKPLKKRSHMITFYGSTTGCGVDDRIKALELLKKNNVSFTGGLFEHDGMIKPPEHLKIPKLSSHEHIKIILDTRVSLAFHGNNPLTYRFYEGLSKGCLVCAQELSEIIFARCGLIEGTHYIAFKKDLSDLMYQIDYFTKNIDKAENIAQKGFEHFKRNFAFKGVDLPQPLYEEILNSWSGLQIKRGIITPYKLVVKWLLPYIHSL